MLAYTYIFYMIERTQYSCMYVRMYPYTTCMYTYAYMYVYTYICI